VVVNRKSRGRVNVKIVAFLKRHEAIWINMYRLLGWRIVERFEMSMDELKKICDELRKLQEALKSFEKVPEWFARHIKPRLFLGGLAIDDLFEFMEHAEKRFTEYIEASKALADSKLARTSFHKHLRASRLLALVITVGDRSGQYSKIKEFLYEVLRIGVAPVDYSYNSVIVAKKIYRKRGVERFWGSIADPEEVMRRLEARPYYVVVECKGVDFEKRNVGWGLKIVT